MTTYLAQREAMARFLRARLGADADVEDLLQDLYLKVVGLDPGLQVRDPGAFLYRLASNLMTDRLRSRRRAAARDGAWRLAAHDTAGAEDRADLPSAEAVVEGRQRLAALERALDRLPSRTQTIFRQHKFDGLSYAEVAAAQGISRSAVEKHMILALKALAASVGRWR